MSAFGRRGSLAPAFLQSEGKEVAAPRCWNSLLCKVDFIKAKASGMCRMIPQQMISPTEKVMLGVVSRFQSCVTLDQYFARFST